MSKHSPPIACCRSSLPSARRPKPCLPGAVADPGAAAEQHLPAPEDPVALGPGRRTGRPGPLPARPGLPATGEEIRSRGLADRSRQTGTQAPGRPEPGERGADGGQQPAGDLPGTVRQSAATALLLPERAGAAAVAWRLGQSLLAHLEDERREELYLAQELSAERIDKLEQELRLIREQGYAVSQGEIDEGVWGISVPLLDSRQRLHGALSLMAPPCAPSRAANACGNGPSTPPRDFPRGWTDQQEFRCTPPRHEPLARPDR